MLHQRGLERDVRRDAANDEGVEMILKNAQKTLDKAAAKGYIHKNAAARLKSSLVKSAKA